MRIRKKGWCTGLRRRRTLFLSVSVIVLLSVLLACSGCSLNAEQPSAEQPEAVNMRRRIEELIGKPVDYLESEYPCLCHFLYSGFAKCEDGYIAYELSLSNWPRTVSAAAGFSTTGALLYNDGMKMISAQRFDSFHPETYGELIEAYGHDSYSMTSGFWNVYYIIDDGRFASYGGWPTGNGSVDWPVSGGVHSFTDIDWENSAVWPRIRVS